MLVVCYADDVADVGGLSRWQTDKLLKKEMGDENDDDESVISAGSLLVSSYSSLMYVGPYLCLGICRRLVLLYVMNQCESLTGKFGTST